MMDIPVIEAGGLPYEIGHTIGAACADRIHAAIAEICVFDEDCNTVDERLTQLVAHIRLTFPEALVEADGIADGAHAEKRDILLLSFATEISGRLPGFCSLLAIPGDRGVWLGKNLDAPAALGPLQVIHCMSPKGGIPYKHIATAGSMWTDGGVNDHGLALVNASLSSKHKEPTGIPDGYLVRETLARCSTTQSALEFLTSHSFRTAGETLLIADVQGCVAALEMVPGRQAIRTDVGLPVVACNHALDHDIAMAQSPDDPIRENSMDRRSSLLGLLQQSACGADDVFALLSDRSVQLTGRDGLWTLASIALSPANCDFRISIPGPDGPSRQAVQMRRSKGRQ